MSRYINVDLYIDYLTELKHSAEKYYRYEEAVKLSQEINRIKDFPLADVAEVKHGEWLKSRSKMECSKCGYFYFSDNVKTNYCCNCGARIYKEC